MPTTATGDVDIRENTRGTMMNKEKKTLIRDEKLGT
jgi:hypothetical protein